MRTDDDACERDAFNTWMKRGKMDTRHLFFFSKNYKSRNEFFLNDESNSSSRIREETRNPSRAKSKYSYLERSTVSRFARSNGRQQDVGSEISQLFHLRSDRVARGGLIAISF